MKKDEVISWLKAVYDKLVLVIVLVAILVSLFMLIFATVGQKKSIANDDWLQPPLVKPRPSGLDLTAVYDAIENIMAPFQISGWVTRMLVAELRVNCVKCNRPIPIVAEVCPFRTCRAQQPRIVTTKDKDTDLDGMPDEWEIRYELGINIDDAAQDADSDGFTNLEEFKSGTNPRDETSAPPPVTKLRLVKAGRIPLPLSFGGAQQSEKDTIFMVKNKRTGRDMYVRMGDVVEGYKITGYQKKTVKVDKKTFVIDEDVSELKVVSKDGKEFNLVLGGKGGAQGEMAAVIIYLIGNVKMQVKKDDVISLKNFKYKIIDIADQNVTLADTQSGAKFILEPYVDPAR
jgi:hypothetical protein